MTDQEKRAAAEKARNLLLESGMAIGRVEVDVKWFEDEYDEDWEEE